MISEFQGPYRWLSNFYSVPVTYHGIMFHSVEHAYQAAKAESEADRQMIARCKTAGEAKRLGRRVKLRTNWEELKLGIMLNLLRSKFSLSELKEKLLATKDEELVEGNYWGDTYWGVCKGVGQNHLGKLLMQVRQELREAQ